MTLLDFILRRNNRALLVLLLFWLPAGVFAQAVRGTVTDGKGQPVIGATVNVKGTNVNTATGDNGSFSINAAKGTTLVFTAVNFETLEQKVTGNGVMSVVMSDKTGTLNDVVVVGYGSRRKRDLTGSVSTLGGDDVVAAKAQSVQEAIQGRVAGVDVRRGNGRSGSDMSIEIRGANSINGSTQPLYVVDGIVMGGINEINPADIERMDILKDASSTAIFGSRGANGVVIVTTKRGVKGPPRISYDAYVGIVNPYNLPPIMDGPRFVDYAREFYNTQATVNNQTTPVPDEKIFSATELANINAGTYTNWVDLIKRNGLQTNHNLAIAGGSDAVVYYMSAGYQMYQDALKAAGVKRYNFKVGLDVTPNKVLKFGGSIIANFSDFTLGSGEVFRSSYRLRPTGSAYNADGTKRFFVYEGESQITNPLFDLDNELRAKQYVKVVPNAYLEVNFLQNLKFRSSFTPDLLFQRSGSYFDMFSKTVAAAGASRGENGADHFFNYTFDNTLSYNKKAGDNQIDVVAGSSVNYYQFDNNLIQVRGLPYKSLWYNVGSATAVTLPNGTVVQPTTTVASYYTRQTIAGFFARANYSYKNRYLLTVTGRYDGHSSLADGNKWDFFPSAGLAWVASDEAFLKDVTAINQLKVRFSTGQSGNAATALDVFYPYVTQSTIGSTLYDFNGSNANGFAPNILADKNLTWEKTTEYNAGLDLTMFRNRVSLTMDVYNKTSRGSIIRSEIPGANGFNFFRTNLGSVRNSGIEIGLTTQNIKTSKLTWSTTFNFARNKNRIIDVFGDGRSDVGNQKFIGQKVRVVYNYKVIGVWQTNEADEAAVYGQKPGQYKIEDFNNDKKIDANDRQILGSNIPDWFGGITSNLTFANFDFAVTVYTRQGTLQQSTFLNQFMNGDQNRARFNAFDRNYWTFTNPSNTWANNAIEQDANRRGAAEFMNSSFTKISNITLGYTFPKSIIGKSPIKKLRVYLDAYNPFIWSKFIGWDPETADANSFSDVDFRMRTFIFGLNLGL